MWRLLLILKLAAANLHTLITYSGPTAPRGTTRGQYHTNFVYFIANGLSNLGDDYHVQVVLTERSWRYYASLINCSVRQVQVLLREDRCYDLEAYRVGLRSVNISFFRFFVFLNCGLFGPLPLGNEIPWPEHFTRELSNTIRLVGLTLNCGGKLGISQAHVQSMMWVTDREGLGTITRAGVLFDCGNVILRGDARSAFINRYELGLSRAVMDAGFLIKAIGGLRFAASNASAPHPAECRDVWTPMNFRREQFRNAHTFWKSTRISSEVFHEYVSNLRSGKSLCNRQQEFCLRMSNTNQLCLM